LFQRFSFAQTGCIITPGSPYDYGRFEDIFFINPQTGWVIKGNGVIFKTTNEGNNWIKLDSLQNVASLTGVGFIDSNTGWITSTNFPRILYKTSNGGANWFIDNSIPNPVPTGLRGVFILGNSNIYLVGSTITPAFFVSSTDRGISWTSYNLSNYADILIDCVFLNKDTGIAVGGIGAFPSQTKPVVLYTSNSGVNWVTKYTGTRNSTWCWQISFPDNNTGYVCIESFSGSPSEFLKTTDGGNTWTKLAHRLNAGYSQQAIGFINSNTGWLGGWSDTTFITTNGGIIWSDAGFGINMSRFRFFGDTVGYSCGQYIYRYSKTTGISFYNSMVSDDYVLYQNFPNPFNPLTIISYKLRVKSFVKLKVFDVMGKEVQNFVNQNQNAGGYKVEFDGSGFSSGVYYYSLFVDGKIINTKKMTLLR